MIVISVISSVLLIGAGGAWVTWSLYETQIRQILGLPASDDYQGQGVEPKVTITIEDGDFGDVISQKLVDAGVTKSFDAVYRILISDASIVFTPGTYTLNSQMSARAAIDFLRDAANRQVLTAVIPEGTVLPKTFQILSDATGIPVSEFEVAANPADFGLPSNAPSIEGFLFPATYEFDPTDTAAKILHKMAEEMNSRLNALGVAENDRYEVVTMAALVQREAGSNLEDFGKIARVFQNRIDQGWKLQSDATVAYGTGNLDTVWTTDAERADESNPYNTYVHDGLPVGPIGAPGEVALEAAISPTEGDWMFFVPINLKTGETVFSVTEAEHSAAAEKLREWCRASEENMAYCD